MDTEFDASRFIGEFRELAHGRPDGPSLRESVGCGSPENLTGIVAYLRGGATLAATGQLTVDALDPQGGSIGELSLRTDGEWFWYSDLAFYVEKYNVTIESEFVENARARDWVCPEVREDELEALTDLFFND
ncbi:hypothetical protein [Streptomyces exfoliatus]|uniref:hypothetical protein n=1 Tax=Streptomyces exfoliatus TaxID=1905 RepID=UPI0037A46AD3